METRIVFRKDILRDILCALKYFMLHQKITYGKYKHIFVFFIVKSGVSLWKIKSNLPKSVFHHFFVQYHAACRLLFRFLLRENMSHFINRLLYYIVCYFAGKNYCRKWKSYCAATTFYNTVVWVWGGEIYGIYDGRFIAQWSILSYITVYYTFILHHCTKKCNTYIYTST